VIQPRAEQRNPRGYQLEVSTHVGGHLDPEAERLALLGRRDLHVLDHSATVDGADVVLGALLYPLHGPVELARQSYADGLFRVDVQLGPKASSYRRRNHPQLLLRYPERQRQRGLGDVRDLGRGVHGHVTAGGLALDDHAARLNRVGDQPGVVVALLDHDGGLREDLVHLPVLQRPGVGLVVPELVVDQRRVLCQRVLDLQDRVERLVVHIHGLDCILRVFSRVRDHNRYRVAREARLVLRHRPVVGEAGVRGGGLRRKRAVGERPRARKPSRPVVG
jgi:hypothetical protein